MYISIITFLGAVYSLSPARRLIINGTPVTDTATSFTVSLMYCRDGGISSPILAGLYCAAFCSGSMIAPNVVLTAAHCLYDRNSGRPTVPIERVHVLIGSSNFQNPSRTSQLVKARKSLNAGFGRSFKFPLDDDIAVIILDACAVGSDYSTVRMASVSSEPKAPCTELTTIGFGRHSSVPPELFVHDGGLRSDITRLHPFTACAEASNFASILSPSKFICSGGDTVSAICNGDSGGPVVAVGSDGELEQVGITSFGKSAFCGNSPDYSTRVATYSHWVRSVIAKEPVCPGHEVAERGEEIPVPNENEDDPDRCPNVFEWRCVSTGKCVSMDTLCDGSSDCDDSSDETAHFCQDWTQKQKFISDTIDTEFDKLINGSEATDNGTAWTSVGWIDIPQFDFVAGPSLRSSNHYAVQCRDPRGAGADLESIVTKKCSSQVFVISSFISTARSARTNSVVGADIVCKAFASCAGKDLSMWVELIDSCSVMSRVSDSERDALRMCGSIEHYTRMEAHRAEYANAFSATFGSPMCKVGGEGGTLPPPYKPVRRALEGDKAGGRVKAINSLMYIIFIAYIYLYI
jgi:hypothetical protein